VENVGIFFVKDALQYGCNNPKHVRIVDRIIKKEKAKNLSKEL
jgi:hypothetical protein